MAVQVFVLGLVGDREDRFSRVVAHMESDNIKGSFTRKSSRELGELMQYAVE